LVGLGDAYVNRIAEGRRGAAAPGTGAVAFGTESSYVGAGPRCYDGNWVVPDSGSDSAGHGSMATAQASVEALLPVRMGAVHATAWTFLQAQQRGGPCLGTGQSANSGGGGSCFGAGPPIGSDGGSSRHGVDLPAGSAAGRLMLRYRPVWELGWGRLTTRPGRSRTFGWRRFWDSNHRWYQVLRSMEARYARLQRAVHWTGQSGIDGPRGPVQRRHWTLWDLGRADARRNLGSTGVVPAARNLARKSNGIPINPWQASWTELSGAGAPVSSGILMPRQAVRIYSA